MASENFSQDVSHIQARLLVIKGNSILNWSRNQIYKAWYGFRLFSQQNISWSLLQEQFLGPERWPQEMLQ